MPPTKEYWSESNMKFIIEFLRSFHIFINFQPNWHIFLQGISTPTPITFLDTNMAACDSYSSVASSHNYSKDISNNSKHICSNLLDLLRATPLS